MAKLVNNRVSELVSKKVSESTSEGSQKQRK